MRATAIDEGIYTIAEACRYINAPDIAFLRDRRPIRPPTLHSWFLDRPDKQGRGPIFESDWSREGKDFAISFMNLIEAFVARFFFDCGVKPARIRRSHAVYQEKLKTKHPFARKELRTDGFGIILCEPDDIPIDHVAKQLYFVQMRQYLAGLNYDPKTLLAKSWTLDKGVAISPKLGFGKPTIKGTGVSTMIVAKQYVANGRDSALVSRLFKITEVGVLNAFRFENRLGHWN